MFPFPPFSTTTMSLVAYGIAIAAIIYAYSLFLSGSKGETFPPRVSTFLPWIGAAFQFMNNPSEFLATCHKKYGSVYKVLIGGQETVVTSSASVISSIYAADPGILGVHTTHINVYEAVSGLKGGPEVYRVTTQLIFPMLDQRLSRRALEDSVPTIAQAVYDRIKPYTETQTARVSLVDFINEPSYAATNLAMFGTRFPSDTYHDLRTLDATMPERFFKVPFWPWKSGRARRRLVAILGDYMNTEDVSDADGPVGSALKKVFRENSIPPEAATSYMLILLWSMHANTIGITLWMFLFLLNDQDALAAVRDEIDRAIKTEFGDFDTFLANVKPKELEGKSFPLLTSVILETMRVVIMFLLFRTANRDWEFKDGGRTVFVPKGEFILGNAQAAHLDETWYKDSHRFVFDRYAQGDYQDGRLPTGGNPWFCLGVGRHLCKGRYLAMYEIKLTALIFLHCFEITPVNEGSKSWWPPKTTKRQLSVPRTETVMVDVRPRHVR
ncbi:cytochrome P450 [Pisolithus croceorrhizus]|nr:cytochrome P450 [Pisolithus croceorrhizus]KAI6132417.1 cytochrome P450 [Pisolithus croceorrhizus]KAI6168739.1 cytochrome P450 [Pisolithus thermaeus]